MKIKIVTYLLYFLFLVALICLVTRIANAQFAPATGEDIVLDLGFGGTKHTQTNMFGLYVPLKPVQGVVHIHAFQSLHHGKAQSESTTVYLDGGFNVNAFAIRLFGERKSDLEIGLDSATRYGGLLRSPDWTTGPFRITAGIGTFMEQEELPQEIADDLGLADGQSTTVNPMVFAVAHLYGISITKRYALSVADARHRWELKPTWHLHLRSGVQLGIQGEFGWDTYLGWKARYHSVLRLKF